MSLPVRTDDDNDRAGHRGGSHHGDLRGDVDLPTLVAAAQAATSAIAVITNAEQRIEYVSASFTTMTGYEQGELLGLNCRVLQGSGTDPGTVRQIKELLGSGQEFEGQILNYRKDGSAFWNALRIVPLRVGDCSGITHFASVQHDVSNTVASIRQLEAQAIHDPLTRLPNRTAAERAVDGAVLRSTTNGLTVAVGLIDLDHFRIVNNTLGHAAGDSVLQRWASRVLARLRDGDVLARMGGDEFLLILRGINRRTAQMDLAPIIDRIHEAVEKPFMVEGQQVHIGMSMGIALVPEDGTDSRSILRSADDALYTVKGRRHEGGSWWETAAQAQADPQHAGTARGHGTSVVTSSEDVGSIGPHTYRQALRSGNVVVHFQPIVDLRTGTVILFEALARLEVPGGRTALPDEFLPHLHPEDLRLLFDDVLEQGLALISGWDLPGTQPNVAVNLPPEILHDETLVMSVEKSLHLHGIVPGRLGLELLESQTLTLETQRAALQRLAGAGIRLAMDDLGSGYSSLQRLSTFPFTAIKLDRGLFLHAYDRPLETLSIMATLVQMGRDLGMTVIVEGLEDEALTEAATNLGAPLGQGYYFAEPMPAGDCGPWVDSFDPIQHRADLRTPLGALAYHWQFARLATPHPSSLETCPLTRFINSVTEDPAEDDEAWKGVVGAGSDNAAATDSGTGVEAWHALQHTAAGAYPDASRLLTDWLTRQIRATT